MADKINCLLARTLIYIIKRFNSKEANTFNLKNVYSYTPVWGPIRLIDPFNTSIISMLSKSDISKPLAPPILMAKFNYLLTISTPSHTR